MGTLIGILIIIGIFKLILEHDGEGEGCLASLLDLAGGIVASLLIIGIVIAIIAAAFAVNPILGFVVLFIVIRWGKSQG